MLSYKNQAPSWSKKWLITRTGTILRLRLGRKITQEEMLRGLTQLIDPRLIYLSNFKQLLIYELVMINTLKL
jgi:hypothetical protein